MEARRADSGNLSVTPDGRSLVVSERVANRLETLRGGQVTSYRVGHDGSLTVVGTAPTAAGITGAAAL